MMSRFVFKKVKSDYLYTHYSVIFKANSDNIIPIASVFFDTESETFPSKDFTVLIEDFFDGDSCLTLIKEARQLEEYRDDLVLEVSRRGLAPRDSEGKLVDTPPFQLPTHNSDETKFQEILCRYVSESVAEKIMEEATEEILVLPF